MFNLETIKVLIAIVILSFMDLVFTRRHGRSPCGHLFSGLVCVALLLWSCIGVALNKVWLVITYPWSDQFVLNHHHYTEARRREFRSEWKSQVTFSVHSFLTNGQGPIAAQFNGERTNIPEVERYKMALNYVMNEIHLNV